MVMVTAGPSGSMLPPTNRPSDATNTSPTQPKPEGIVATNKGCTGLSGRLDLPYVAIHAAYPLYKLKRIRSTVES